MGDGRLCLIGGGHGAVAALESLQARIGALCAVTDDGDVARRLRPADRRLPSLAGLRDRVIVCAGHGGLLDARTVSENVAINTHPSLLPAYRGMHALVWAMLNGEPEFGFTIHLMNAEIDDGDILAQFRVGNTGQDSARIWRDFDAYVRENLADVVLGYLAGAVTPVPQDRDRATWVPRRNLADCELDWTEPNARLRALLRALVPPYPLPRLRTRETLYAVTGARILDRDYHCTLGRVVGHLEGTALVKSAEGLVRIDALADAQTGAPVAVTAALPVGLRLPGRAGG